MARSGLLLVLCAGALALTSCHRLLNPVDPSSRAYGGIASEPGYDQESPAPPSAILWQSAMRHAPSIYLTLDITEDGQFVEPRSVSLSSTDLLLAISYDQDLPESYRDARLFDVAVRYLDPDTEEEYAFSPFVVVDQSSGPRQLLLHLVGVPQHATVAIRSRRPDGSVAGERSFGVLAGDVGGDGLVTEDDLDIVFEFYDQVIDAGDEENVRADIVPTATVDFDDQNVVLSGLDLPGLPTEAPEFLGDG